MYSLYSLVCWRSNILMVNMRWCNFVWLYGSNLSVTDWLDGNEAFSSRLPCFFLWWPILPTSPLDCPNARPQVTRATAKYRHEMPAQYVTLSMNMLRGSNSSEPEGNQTICAASWRCSSYSSLGIFIFQFFLFWRLPYYLRISIKLTCISHYSKCTYITIYMWMYARTQPLEKV